MTGNVTASAMVAREKMIGTCDCCEAALAQL